MVVNFDLAFEFDSRATFLAVRASRRIADDANAAVGEALNAKPVINSAMRSFNRETVEDATGLRVAVGVLCSARGPSCPF